MDPLERPVASLIAVTLVSAEGWLCHGLQKNETSLHRHARARLLSLIFHIYRICQSCRHPPWSGRKPGLIAFSVSTIIRLAQFCHLLFLSDYFSLWTRWPPSTCRQNTRNAWIIQSSCQRLANYSLFTIAVSSADGRKEGHKISYNTKGTAVIGACPFWHDARTSRYAVHGTRKIEGSIQKIKDCSNWVSWYLRIVEEPMWKDFVFGGYLVVYQGG